MAIDYVPQLIKAGVRSFKIEGRLKGPEYVAITTQAYRKAVDEAWDLLDRGLSATASVSASASATTSDRDSYRPKESSSISAGADAGTAAARAAAAVAPVAGYSGPDPDLRRDLRQVFARGQVPFYSILFYSILCHIEFN